jgi:hypothetical protein
MALNGRRLGLAAWVLVAALPLSSQTRNDRPEGVPSDRWISLGEDAGIVITSRPARVNGRPGEAKGELWVRLDGSWSPAALEQARQMLPAR